MSILWKKKHIKRYCLKWKKEFHTSNSKHEKVGSDDNSNCVHVTSSYDLLFVYSENLINLVYNETNWVVDSGDQSMSHLEGRFLLLILQVILRL